MAEPAENEPEPLTPDEARSKAYAAYGVDVPSTELGDAHRQAFQYLFTREAKWPT